MPTYRIFVSTEPHEPFPPLDKLPTVEALDPISAVHELLAQGRYPQNKFLRWARVILSVHPNGQPHHVIRVPVEVSAVLGLPRVIERTDEFAL